MDRIPQTDWLYGDLSPNWTKTFESLSQLHGVINLVKDVERRCVDVLRSQQERGLLGSYAFLTNILYFFFCLPGTQRGARFTFPECISENAFRGWTQGNGNLQKALKQGEYNTLGEVPVFEGNFAQVTKH